MFLKETKRKQKWTTFARIHKLACQRNTWPCAPSILKQQKCAYWDTSGFQEVTLRKSIRKAERFIGHWLPKKWGKTCKSIFSRETFFGRVFGTLPRNVSIQNPPLQKNRFLFGLGRPIRNMLSIFQDDRYTILSNRMAYFRALSRSTKACQAQTNNKLSTAKINIS